MYVSVQDRWVDYFIDEPHDLDRVDEVLEQDCQRETSDFIHQLIEHHTWDHCARSEPADMCVLNQSEGVAVVGEVAEVSDGLSELEISHHLAVDGSRSVFEHFHGEELGLELFVCVGAFFLLRKNEVAVAHGEVDYSVQSIAGFGDWSVGV